MQRLVLTPYITHKQYGHIVISGQNHAGYGISGSTDQPTGAGKIGVNTPHLNYISGKAAVMIPTGDVTISEGSYVLSYPLGVTPGHSYWYQEQFDTIYKDEGSRVNETGTARDGGTINMQDGDVPNYSLKNIRIIILYGGITNENFGMDLVDHCLDQYCLCCLLYLPSCEK